MIHFQQIHLLHCVIQMELFDLLFVLPFVPLQHYLDFDEEVMQEDSDLLLIHLLVDRNEVGEPFLI